MSPCLVWRGKMVMDLVWLVLMTLHLLSTSLWVGARMPAWPGPDGEMTWSGPGGRCMFSHCFNMLSSSAKMIFAPVCLSCLSTITLLTVLGKTRTAHNHQFRQ